MFVAYQDEPTENEPAQKGRVITALLNVPVAQDPSPKSPPRDVRGLRQAKVVAKRASFNLTGEGLRMGVQVLFRLSRMESLGSNEFSYATNRPICDTEHPQ